MNWQIVNGAKLFSQHERLLQQTDGMMRDSLENAGEFAERYVRTNPGFKPKTGKTQRATGHAQFVRGQHGRILKVFNTAKHARSLEYGSRPHPIAARRSKALRFVAGGKLYFRKAVQHPGTRPYRFLFNATDAASRVLGRELERGMTRIAQKFSR